MKKKVTVRAIVLLLVFLLLLSGCGRKQHITGEQLILAHVEFSEVYLKIMEELAESYSEYIAYNMSEKEFKEDIKGYLKRMEYEEKRYEKFNKKYQLAPEVIDTKALEIVGHIHEVKKCVKTILEKTIVDGRALPREELLELYIEVADEIQEHMTSFEKALDEY